MCFGYLAWQLRGRTLWFVKYDYRYSKIARASSGTVSGRVRDAPGKTPSEKILAEQSWKVAVSQAAAQARAMGKEPSSGITRAVNSIRKWIAIIHSNGLVQALFWSTKYDTMDGAEGIYVDDSGYVYGYSANNGSRVDMHFETSGAAWGTWSNGIYSGTISGSKQTPAYVAAYAGSYTATLSGGTSGTLSFNIDYYGYLTGFGTAAGETTKLSDLSILCANCHRMIHRSKPMLTVTDLKQIVSDNKSIDYNTH